MCYGGWYWMMASWPHAYVWSNTHNYKSYWHVLLFIFTVCRSYQRMGVDKNNPWFSCLLFQISFLVHPFQYQDESVPFTRRYESWSDGPGKQRIQKSTLQLAFTSKDINEIMIFYHLKYSVFIMHLFIMNIMFYTLFAASRFRHNNNMPSQLLQL